MLKLIEISENANQESNHSNSSDPQSSEQDSLDESISEDKDSSRGKQESDLDRAKSHLEKRALKLKVKTSSSSKLLLPNVKEEPGKENQDDSFNLLSEEDVVSLRMAEDPVVLI